MNRTFWLAMLAGAIVAALLFATAWALGFFSGPSAVTGTITTQVGDPLPPDAIVTVSIEDVSLTDGASAVIAEQTITSPGQMPIAFEVAFDPDAIDESHTYSVRARIESSDGRLLFTSDTVTPVITQGHPTEDVVVNVVAISANAVTGTVTYQVRSALPPDAVTIVRLQNISRADASAEILAETRLVGGQVPIPYELVYDPAAIIDNNTYSVSARIEDAQGNLLFISDTVTPVLTNGNPTQNVEIMTVPVGSAEVPATITGNVTYLVRSALPPDAITTVQLLDVSLADAPATVLGEQQIVGGQVPIPFEINYNSSDIQPTHSYSLFARITDAQGNLLFISGTSVPVITNGAPSDGIEIQVVPVAGDDSGGMGNTVTGTVTYLQRIALPEDAVLTVEILDVSLADAAATVVGRSVLPSPGQVPIAYEVIYDPGIIQDTHTYSMHAKIVDGAGNLLFISDTITPVITDGNPTENVEVLVVPVAVDTLPAENAVTGTVTYLQRIALPPTSQLTVTVQDVSVADAPAVKIGSVTFSDPGASPIPYEVAYDANLVDENRDYAISARIESAHGRLLFISDTRIPVITKGNPVEDVEIPVVAVSAE